MRRSHLLPLGLVALVALSGCSAIDTHRYPVPRPGGVDIRPADVRPDRGPRADARAVVEAQRRVERDVRRYVRALDRELRLERRQELRIREILENRAYRHLRGARRHDLRRVYPFPRQFNRDRYRTRSIASFWRDTDRRIERHLTRRQVREYRYLTGQNRTRGKRDQRRYRDDDRWYDDGRRDDRRRDDRRRDDG